MKNKVNEEVVCGVYKITSPTGRIYIGQSINIYYCWRVRYVNKRKIASQKLLYNSLSKYGHDNHIFEIIHVCEKEQLNYYEGYYIRLHDSYNTLHGMNLTIGGGGTSGYKHTDDAKNRISINTKGNKNCLGVKQSSEHIKNRIKGMTGKKRSREFRERLREVNLGKKMSEETKEKIRKIVNQPEYKKRMLSYRLGVKMSPEGIEKIVMKMGKLILNTQTGIFYYGTPEAAKSANISETHLNRKLKGDVRDNTSFIYA